MVAAIPCYSLFLTMSQLLCRRRNQKLQHLCLDISDIVNRLSTNECSSAVRGVCCEKATRKVWGAVSSHFVVANSESEFKILNKNSA